MATYEIHTLGDEKVKITEDLLYLSSYLSKIKNNTPIKIQLSSSVFNKVVQYLELLKSLGELTIPEPLPDTKKFSEIFPTDKVKYSEFIEVLDYEMIFELINAGALLELNGLHDLACAKIAHFMKGKTPDEVNKFFTIECQLTNDEAKELGLDLDEDVDEEQ